MDTRDKSKFEPLPGSPEAIEKGCTCPRGENNHGRGYLGDGEKYGYVMMGNCPLHGCDVPGPEELS